MTGEDFLLAIAQIGLTLAGFAALIGVFRGSEKGWTESERVGQRLILELSLLASAMAVVPIAIYHTLGETPVWRISSALLILVVVGWGWSVTTRSKNLQLEQTNEQKTVSTIGQIVALVALIIQAVNIVWWGAFGGFIWGLLWMLFSAALQFMLFVYAYAKPSPDA